MAIEYEEVCQHPECESHTNLFYVNGEWFCPDHFDYGMGRAFGPLHRALTALRRGELKEEEAADHE